MSRFALPLHSAPYFMYPQVSIFFPPSSAHEFHFNWLRHNMVRNRLPPINKPMSSVSYIKILRYIHMPFGMCNSLTVLLPDSDITRFPFGPRCYCLNTSVSLDKFTLTFQTNSITLQKKSSTTKSDKCLSTFSAHLEPHWHRNITKRLIETNLTNVFQFISSDPYIMMLYQTTIQISFLHTQIFWTKKLTLPLTSTTAP